MNAIERILARHSEQDVVAPGEVVMVDVDVTVQFDHARPDVLKIANPKKLVLVHDHVVPAPTVQAATAIWAINFVRIMILLLLLGRCPSRLASRR